MIQEARCRRRCLLKTANSYQGFMPRAKCFCGAQVRNAITKARQTIRNIDWFEVKNIRGSVNKAGDPTFQVEVRIGFRLEGDPVV